MIRTRRAAAIGPAVVAAVGVAAAFYALQVVGPPAVGLANNGDFEKIMGWVGLRAPAGSGEDRYFAYVLPRYEMVRPMRDRDGYLSSETALAAAARVVAQASGAVTFDLRLLGAVHAVLLLLAIGALVAAGGGLSPPGQWVAAALLVFFFTDVGYGAPLTSLYSQVASLVFLLLTAAAAALAIRRGRLEGLLGAAYFLCAAAFVCSKPQEAVLAPLLAAFGWALARPGVGQPPGRAARWAAIGLVLLAAVYFLEAPRRLRQQSLYNLVFFELLPRSPAPESDLTALGLDPSLARYAGTSAYSEGTAFSDPTFREELLARTGYGAVARLYASRPDRLWSALRRASADALTLRPRDLGNFAREAGFPPGSKSRRFSAWSRLRERATPAGLWVAALLLGSFAISAAGYRSASWQGRRSREGIALLATMAAIAFVIAAAADGHMEMARHLFLFQALCDLLLIADVTWLAQVFRRNRTPA